MTDGNCFGGSWLAGDGEGRASGLEGAWECQEELCGTPWGDALTNLECWVEVRAMEGRSWESLRGKGVPM